MVTACLRCLTRWNRVLEVGYPNAQGFQSPYRLSTPPQRSRQSKQNPVFASPLDTRGDSTWSKRSPIVPSIPVLLLGATFPISRIRGSLGFGRAESGSLGIGRFSGNWPGGAERSEAEWSGAWTIPREPANTQGTGRSEDKSQGTLFPSRMAGSLEIGPAGYRPDWPVSAVCVWDLRLMNSIKFTHLQTCLSSSCSRYCDNHFLFVFVIWPRSRVHD